MVALKNNKNTIKSAIKWFFKGSNKTPATPRLVSIRGLSNGPYKKDSATRQGMQKGANFCTTLLLLYHTSDWLNQ